MTHAVLQRARALRDVLRDASNEVEQQRRLTDDVVRVLKEAQLFRMFVPAAYGGPEVDPLTVMDTITELACADAASAWCVCIASQTSHVSGSLEPHWATALFGDASNVAVGAFAPSGMAHAVDGGHRVTGNWAWGSGIDMAQWVTGGSITANGESHIMFFARDQVVVRDTWYSSGLCGTGSHDFSVEDVFVPSGRSVQTLAAKPRVDAPIARTPLFALFASGIASVMVGIAQRALEELIALATVKKPMSSQRTIAEQQLAQTELGGAEVRMRAAHVLLHDEMASVWGSVLNGDRVSTEQRVRVRGAAYHVSETARATVEACCELAGGTAVYSRSPLQRCLRDVHTASAHIMVNRRNLEMLGRHRFGQEIDLSML